MRNPIKVIQMLIRLDGVVILILGLVFWSGRALTLIPVHTWLGILLVLALWVLAVLAMRSGVQPALPTLAIVWGLVVAIVGMIQTTLLPGPSHVIIQLVHLLLGLGAIGLGEALASRSLRERPLGPATA